MRETIVRLIEASGIPSLGVAIRSLDGRISFGHHEHHKYHAASTMKVPVMMALFAQIHSGKLKFDQPVLLSNGFIGITDGAVFQLDPDQDSEPTLYERLGETASLEELVELMITHSSNLATNILINLVSAQAVQLFLESSGVKGFEVLRGVEDAKAFALGRNNLVTAAGYSQTLSLIASNDTSYSQRMLAILRRQTHRSGLPADLPPGTWIANKPGWNDKACHDGGVIGDHSGPQGSVVVLTEGAASQAEAQRFISQIGHEAARWLMANQSKRTFEPRD
jgi:beta-lactamase class A